MHPPPRHATASSKRHTAVRCTSHRPPCIAPPAHTAQVDYRQGRLSFKVGQQGQAATRDVKSLSGGERSLVSLAFILALGAWPGRVVGGQQRL